MPSPLRHASELLVQYAAYHRDRRNIATHFVGIPMIVFALSVLLAKPAWSLGGASVPVIAVVWLLSTLWYLTRGLPTLGVATSAVNGLLALAAMPLASLPRASWAAWGVGLFVLGWIIQFIGHRYEGRKPAFLDDLVGLLVGPMFVVAETMFAWGWNPSLQATITTQAGPVRSGSAARHA